MKILLIKPYCTVYKNNPTIPGMSFPLGLAYLAAFLRTKKIDVQIIDALSEGISEIQRLPGKIRYGLADKQITERLLFYNPQVVGISSMYTAYFRDVHEIALLVKKINPKIKVVLGGAHVSLKPALSLKDKNIDAVVRGEGEISFYEMVAAIENKAEYHQIKGTVVRYKDQIYDNPPRKYVSNLDLLPFPAYDLLPMGIYLKATKDSPYSFAYPQISIITSRGCPGDCCYCSIHSIWGHAWRGRSPKNVVDEMEMLVDKYKIKEFAFLDDNLACSSLRLNGICDEIIKRRLKIKWATPNGISHWTLNEKMLEKMKKSGCYRLTFGIESGNSKTREFIGWKKRFGLKQAKRIIKYANKIGLWTACTFIFGFPKENRKMINETIKFAVESDTDFAAFFLLMPFFGTRVYDFFEKEGILDFRKVIDPTLLHNDSDYSKLGSSLAMEGVNTKYFTGKELKNILNLAYSTFFKK